MRATHKLNTGHELRNVSVRFEKTFIYLTALGFLSIAGIYLLFI